MFTIINVKKGQNINYQEEIEDATVGHQCSKDEKHASNHPGGDGRHPLGIGRDVGDGVEDVDQHQEERDKESHAPGDNLWRDEEADPGHDDKESTWQVVDVQISAIRILISNSLTILNEL